MEARYGHYRLGLRGQSGEREGFALIAAANEERDERTYARRVQKAHCTHIQNDILRGFSTRSRQEFVYGFEAKFALEFIDGESLCTSREFFQIQFERLHNLTKVAHMSLPEH